MLRLRRNADEGPVSIQTVRLSRGKHTSPKDGTCVAELVSMLAGERYTDRPSCACPALTAFLRGYNDGLDDRHRQDLYGLAADLVGTRSCQSVSTARGERLVDLAWQYRRRVGPLNQGPILFGTRFERYEQAGVHLGVCARRNQRCHAEVINLLQEILALPISAFRLDDESPNVIRLAQGEAVQPTAPPPVPAMR
jgi:hypothetical protein